MPKTSSEDRLASATEDLVEILQKLHPVTPFWDQGTKTNDAIQELQKIFKPRQRDSAESTRMQGTGTRVSTRSPTINENEIGAILQKRYNNAIHNGGVTHSYDDEQLYFISYENGEN